MRKASRLEGRINLLYVIDKLEFGGTEKQLMSLVNGLDRTRFSATIVTLRENDVAFGGMFQCPIISMNVPSLASLNGLKKLIRLIQYIRSDGIDIVQTFFIDATIFGILAGRMGGAKFLITSRRDMGYWYTKPILICLRFVNRLADGMIVNSESIRDKVSEVEKFQKEKMAVIHNGLPEEVFVRFDKATRDRVRRSIGIGTDDLVVGILSNLNRRVKGVDLFIRAAQVVSCKLQNAFFVIAGDGHLKQELMVLCKNLCIHQKVKFLGRIENVQELLTSFDVAVNSSTSEGFSNAILEYMASGLPVVATDCMGNKEMIVNGREGLLVPPDPEKIGEAVLRIIGDKSLRKELGEAARTRVKIQYSIEKMTRSTESFYEECLASKRAMEGI